MRSHPGYNTKVLKLLLQVSDSSDLENISFLQSTLRHLSEFKDTSPFQSQNHPTCLSLGQNPRNLNFRNAYGKSKKCIFSFWFSWNWFTSGIISNDFWSSTISAIPIQRSHTEFKSMARISIERSLCICLDTEKSQITRADFIRNTKTSVKNQELGWA